MIRRPPRSTRTDTLFPYTTRFRSSAFRELDSAAQAFNAMLGGLRWFETYVPRSLVMRLIRLGEDGVESEERQVTVMFTDIAGFTTASQQLTPHDTADFLNQIGRASCRERVCQYV